MILNDFKEILEKYPIEKEKNYAGNEFAAKMRNEFTDDFKNFVNNIVNDTERYNVKISHGNGEWVNIPWAGLRNIDSTITFQGGLYLLFVFDFENEGFYLSLDQGNTFPGKKQIRIAIANFLINLIIENNIIIPQGFVYDETKLYDDTIMSKFYKIQDVTISQIENDLKNMIGIYEFLIPYYMDYVVDNELFDEYSQKWILNANKNYNLSSKLIRNYLDENNLGNYEIDEYEEMFLNFKEKFAPEILEKFEGIDIINKLFLHDGDKDNLCYNLEFSDEFRKAGSIKGGSYINTLFIRTLMEIGFMVLLQRILKFSVRKRLSKLEQKSGIF